MRSAFLEEAATLEALWIAACLAIRSFLQMDDALVGGDNGAGVVGAVVVAVDMVIVNYRLSRYVYDELLRFGLSANVLTVYRFGKPCSMFVLET